MIVRRLGGCCTHWFRDGEFSLPLSAGGLKLDRLSLRCRTSGDVSGNWGRTLRLGAWYKPMCQAPSGERWATPPRCRVPGRVVYSAPGVPHNGVRRARLVPWCSCEAMHRHAWSVACCLRGAAGQVSFR